MNILRAKIRFDQYAFTYGMERPLKIKLSEEDKIFFPLLGLQSLFFPPMYEQALK